MSVRRRPPVRVGQRMSAVACAMLLAGCATGPEAEPAPHPAPAGTRPLDPATQAHLDRCNELLRDIRHWCRGGLRVDVADASFECLDARMALARECLAPR